ncbi:hypothetical protein JCM21900_001395, partial [Sporobolomyces salmonicolor]
NAPIDGDGNISAFRIKDGRADFKMKYVRTDRFKLERAAGKALFGLYRNPFSHHPCVQAAVDTTANTNVVYWAGKLLALKEVGAPYVIDPVTLDTLEYDPYSAEITSRTFTAHPKVDPFTEELVTFGYEAKGLATLDVATWTLNKQGKKVDELWIKAPFVGFIHDCIITENYLLLNMWPFEASIERMKKGGHHWAWNYDRPATFVVVPRHAKSLRPDWKDGESRVYTWENCMAIHTGGAWEENGSIVFDSSRVHDNAFPFFPPDDGRMPSPNTKADYVRWTIDLSQPSGTKVKDPVVLIDTPVEFPRVDERFLTKRTHVTFLPSWVPRHSDPSKNIFAGLNGITMYDDRDRSSKIFYAGDGSLVQEPAFIPRTPEAEEGDGFLVALIERVRENRNELVILDTKDMENPVAFVQLPFHVKAQVHGNWVDAERLTETERRPIIPSEEPGFVKGKASLDFIQ